MRYPALNDLIKLADNKYSLVLATAKRAREIVEGDEPLVKIKIDNPVTIATNEISEEMIHCVHKVHEPDEDLSSLKAADNQDTALLAE
ncbi:DNA-directed RNA polymerase subunit omega [Acetobacterium carbinolicum]|jgi:DNA-directed RNA polymerase subunit omega|uniref:DNA-directed RNA polymerase subunit omega n=1 Tax=Acetobacterium TaxID=33951 RepID=UPI000DBEAF2E|nr:MULTISPECIES: DNA-directed RNA polymerase subunit omega [unclassified Acetobacterium]AWW25362.1 DNA-directed RNA polymerase subunit omega [Acetobacterium sp. KB-1]MDK2941483.1 DNA-directed polymerase subunit omega [Acetobacterium sp.]MDZ5723872.1 DNA-directed RNA polymerase subunit omega [Acetobacterium sp. K1/6]